MAGEKSVQEQSAVPKDSQKREEVTIKFGKGLVGRLFQEPGKSWWKSKSQTETPEIIGHGNPLWCRPKWFTRISMEREYG